VTEVEIRTYDNGPLLVTGEVTLTDAEGGRYATEQKSIALCRCGGSENKPFCDGTHSKIGFDSICRAGI